MLIQLYFDLDLLLHDDKLPKAKNVTKNTFSNFVCFSVC